MLSSYYTVYTNHKLCIFFPAECIQLFRIFLRINSDYFPKQHKQNGIYNEDSEWYVR